MSNHRNFRNLRLAETPSSIVTLASIDESARCLPAIGSFRAMPFYNHDLGITTRGATTFDYLDNALRIAPRTVISMDWYSERGGSRHEYIVLKVSERVHCKDVWIRFLPYSEDNIGDFAYTEATVIPVNAELSASLVFENGVYYPDVLETRHKMRKLLQGRNTKANRYAHASRYIGMLLVTVGSGVGSCSPRDLCKIWSIQPNFDQHLRAFHWYIQETSGLDYITLQVVATLDFETDQRWWVRLERDDGNDRASISGSCDLIVLRDSTLTHQMTFRDGVPFEYVRDVLYDMPPTGADDRDESWQYASQLSYGLTMKVDNDLGECSTEDLCQMWSSNDALVLHVIRAQFYQENRDGAPEYMLINVSGTSQAQGRSELWARFEYDATSGTDVNWASISQNRRRLHNHGSKLIANKEFDGLEFKNIESIIRQPRSSISQSLLRPSIAEMLPAFLALSDHVGLSQISAPVITSTMTMAEVIQHLVRKECPNITSRLDLPRCPSEPISNGGFGDVYQGLLCDNTSVALKCIKLSFNEQHEEDQKALKNAAHELYAWSKCKHENIVPLLGLAVFRNRLAMVSPWMKCGNLSELNKTNFAGDLCNVCAQVCRGLAYLHREQIVHGDLKGANVLLSEDGRAKITDFGNTVLRDYTLQFTQASSRLHFSLRWTAPELFENKSRCSKEADIFALGMTVLEVVSGRRPYENIKRDMAVMYAITTGKTPERPERISSESKKGDVLWSLLRGCWAFDPRERPEAAMVEKKMGNIKQSDLL